MIKVYRIHNDEYTVLDQWTGKAYNGNRIKTIATMFELGVEDDEIEMGLADLQFNDQHVAHYGVNKIFIFSEKVA